MNIRIWKSRRLLELLNGPDVLFTCRVALGRCPEGPKQMEGDGRTPEGCYRICLIKEQGKYGRSLGLSYPGPADAEQALGEGRIDRRTFDNIMLAHAQERRPPWGSPLGGEIYLHEGGVQTDWTQGCIALNKQDMDRIFPLRGEIEDVHILP